MNLTSKGVAVPLSGELVTGSYFKTLQVHPALGRLLNDGDIEAAVGNPVCVVSYSAWQQHFGGDPHIIGRKISLNGRPYTVLGVTERGFFGSKLHARIDVQAPVSRMADFMGGFFSSLGGGPAWKVAGFSWLEPLGRLKPGITAKQAEASLQPLYREINRELARPDRGNTTLELREGSQGSNAAQDKYARPLLVLMSVVALVLLIACANLANLLLARAVARQKEFAVRLSLGASRGRLMRQLLVENFLLAACGGAAGLLLSFWIVGILQTFLNTGSPSDTPVQAMPDPAVIGFCLALSFACALLFGLAPAWQSAKPDILPQLKQVSASAPGEGGHAAMRKGLVVFQISLSVVILFAAGLLTRTLSHLQTVDLGFQPASVLALSIDSSVSSHSVRESDRIFDEILSRLRSQRGVAAASVTMDAPLDGNDIELNVGVPGHEKSEQAAFNMISPGYFATLRQPLLAGRDFSERDGRNAPHVAIINQTFASKYFPRVNPVGRHMKAAGGDTEIVGVVQTAHYEDIRETPKPQVYLPVKQTQTSGYTLLVRTTGTASDIERVIHSVNSQLSISNVRTLDEQIEQGISSERVLSFLSTLFSVLAILLCGIGLYGIVSYAVSSRTREIGVRFAIGAQRADVVWLFLRENLLLIAAGAIIGVPAALVSTGVLKALLFGLEPTDPGTLITAVAILALAGLVATILPVRRAASIEPLTALRHE